ncbi:MAG: nuclear transport factor 2 family protein [Elusimicrobia bacterium]|nr:nuclear transport factor 2 family protein [Elusimicrobiota bacterium]
MTLALVLAFSLVSPSFAQENAKTELMKIKDAYERAFSENKPELLMPYLSDDFGGKMLFQDIRGKDGMKRFWDKVSSRFGDGENAKGYEVRLKPEKIDVDGNKAKAEGTTEETVDTPLGKITYQSTWSANLQNNGGGWKVTQMDSRPDPASSVSRWVSSFVSAAWLKDNSIAPKAADAFTAKDYRHRFKRIAAQNPDFDGHR